MSVPNHQAAEKQWLVVREFVSEREDWSSYIEQLESYFVANYVVTSDKKNAILLSVCGPRTCQLIRNLTTPVTQSLKWYDWWLSNSRRCQDASPKPQYRREDHVIAVVDNINVASVVSESHYVYSAIKRDSYVETKIVNDGAEVDNQQRAHHIEEDKPGTDEQEDTYNLINITSERSKPIRVTVSPNGVEVVMDVDTGAAMSILNESTYNHH